MPECSGPTGKSLAIGLARGTAGAATVVCGYCDHPPFALQRRGLLGDERVINCLPDPPRTGTTALTLTPPELIDQSPALIPPLRRGLSNFARGQ